MAFSNLQPCVHLLIFTIFFLLLLDTVKSNDSIRFSFPNFWSENDLTNITFHGDAIRTTGTLQLTKTDENGVGARQSAGQALFSENVHLWDAATGRVASFYTSFNFLLKITIADEEPADGFGFFLAPPDFNVKDYGGNLGLFNFSTATDTSKNQVVAVEFDTWHNEEYNDPEYRHIGVDVNSIASVATRRWNDRDVFSGSIGTAHISYDAHSKVLTSVVTYPNGGDYTLSYVIDLTKVLPEWIRVGFSGGTGHYQVHYILSWHFSSTLETISVGSEKKKSIRSVV